MGKKIDRAYEELLALAQHYTGLAQKRDEPHDYGAAEAAIEALRIVAKNRQ